MSKSQECFAHAEHGKQGCVCCERWMKAVQLQKPDCTKPSEFVKKFRAGLNTQNKTVIVHDGYEACDLIDHLQAQNKRLVKLCKECSIPQNLIDKALKGGGK